MHPTQEPPPHELDSRCIEANDFKDAGRHTEAEALYRRILDADADYFFALYNLASLLYDVERHDEAEGLLVRAVAVSPDDADSFYFLALVYEKQSRTDEATDAFREAVRCNPDYANAHAAVGFALMDTDPQTALFHHRRAESLAETAGKPTDIHRYNIAVCLRALQRAAEAVPILLAYLDGVPGDAEAACVLANCCTNLGSFDKAEEWFRVSLDAAPDSIPTLNNYGRLLRLMKRYADSEAVLRRGVALAPDDTDLLWNLGLTVEQLDHAEEACTLYRRVADLDPAYPDAHEYAADILADLDRWNEAIAYYRAALTLEPHRKFLTRRLRWATARARRHDRRAARTVSRETKSGR